uniref:Uncharacterized protein n=1 Tax=Oryza sativa subsp. japonica TaxID=39947 RepID=Q69XV6_ORYSJ|nr:hypothetical protein [Oryza sativa Japonica Group]
MMGAGAVAAASGRGLERWQRRAGCKFNRAASWMTMMMLASSNNLTDDPGAAPAPADYPLPRPRVRPTPSSRHGPWLAQAVIYDESGRRRPTACDMEVARGKRRNEMQGLGILGSQGRGGESADAPLWPSPARRRRHSSTRRCHSQGDKKREIRKEREEEEGLERKRG